MVDNNGILLPKYCHDNLARGCRNMQYTKDYIFAPALNTFHFVYDYLDMNVYYYVTNY